jgi:probable phosphoglycerate mutase
VSDLQCAATVLVARHGEAAYESDAETDEGGSLTPLGRAQALELADRVQGQRVATIWTSPMSRAVQTAEIIAARIDCPDVRVREALREYAVGQLAEQPDVPGFFADVFAAWRRDELAVGFPGGDTGEGLLQRVNEVLVEIADLHRGECALVITHGGVMSFVLPRLARNLPHPQAVGAALDNGSIVDLAADADGWVCRSWAGRPIEPAPG